MREDHPEAMRDIDWVLAIGHALGLDSGFVVPLVPSVDEFRKLFAAVRAGAPSAEPPAQAATDDYPIVARLADISKTTVGYQKYELEREAVLLYRARQQQAREIARLNSASTGIIRSMDLETERAERAEAERDALRECVREIVDAYDHYRRRGVAPAPVEYADVVRAIDAARAKVTKP